MIQTDSLIVGGGLAGTTIAAELHPRKKEFLLLEGAPRLGGKIETRWTPDGCFEFGPNSFTNKSEEIFHLLSLLKMEEEILEPAPAAKKRYILKKGKIVQLPAKPPEIFTTQALSLRGKLRFLSEAFHVPPKKEEEESVWDFFARHFGSEVADFFADPFVSGIYAGDPHLLSLSAAFPTMAEAESRAGSLLRYLIKGRKTAKATPQTYQLKRGLESLFIRAREILPAGQIHLEEEVKEISFKQNLAIVTSKETYGCQKLYLTSPAYVSALLLKSLPEAAGALRQIEYAPVVTAHFKVRKEETYPFDGFGILIPSKEGRKILGVLWNSSTFPPLFPDKSHHYLTVYAGGARHPDLVAMSGDRLREMLTSELHKLFSLKSPPFLLHMRRHERAIPQYNKGYGKIVKTLQTALASSPNIRLAGNYLGGISMPDTVATAIKVIAS